MEYLIVGTVIAIFGYLIYRKKNPSGSVGGGSHSNPPTRKK